MSAGPRPEAWLMPAPNGARFCLQHLPLHRPVTQSWIVVHGFAEELNKCRRMVALQARALVNCGAAVLQIDLRGCGDSSGEFGATTWTDWVDDVVRAVHWMQAEHKVAVGLWGIRAGCLLAAQAARQLGTPIDCLFWQPVTSGKTHLNQFIRLIAAANWSAGDTAPNATKRARAAWQAGQSVEIAGYEVSAGLALGLEAAMLQPAPTLQRLAWFQVPGSGATGTPGTSMAFAQDQHLQAWRGGHAVVHAQSVDGPPFWSTQEIEVAPALIDATTQWVCAPTHA